MIRRTPRDEATVLDLVSMVYDASFDRQRWKIFFEACGKAMRANAFGLSFIAFDLWSDRPPLASGIEPAMLPSYPRYHERDPVWSSALRTHAVGTVCDVLPPSTLERTTIYDEWLRPQDLRHVLHVLLWRDPPQRAGLLVGRRADTRPFGQRERQLLEQLVPHLRRSIDIQRRVGVADVVLAGGLDVLDGLAIGVLLVDDRSRVVFANRSADHLLAKSRLLVVRQRVLQTTDADTTSRLHALVTDSAGTTAERGLGVGGGMRIRADADSALHVLVTPLGSHLRDAWHSSGMAAILISDSGRDAAVSRDALLYLYGLTRAQADLAALLIEGKSLAEIADELRLTIGTVRDRVKQVFERTGTRRQSDLMRLVLRGPASFCVTAKPGRARSRRQS